MPSAAERFYERSHELNKRRSDAPQPEVAVLAAQMRQPSHRYHSVIQYLESHPGLEIVELGFGSPVAATALGGMCRELTVVDVADRRDGYVMPENTKFVKSDLNDDFDLPDAAFDCVIAMMVIEHLFDPFHSFSEVCRIARPGARIFINLPNVGALQCRLQLLRGKMPITSSKDWFEKREWDGNHLHYFTVAEVLRLAAVSGLVLERMFPVGNSLKVKALRPSLFCHEISYVFSKPA